MKKFVFILITSLSFNVAFAQSLKPYILGATSTNSMEDVKSSVKSGLGNAGFTIVGEYQPVSESSRWVMVVSHPELDKAVKSVGGLTGFASTLRVGITKEGGILNISYTNPPYWGNAYFRDDFDKVSAHYTKLETAFKNAVANIGEAKGTSFGSEDGVEIDDLKDYHYMFGMPYFDDTEEFGDFDSHAQAVSKIEKSLQRGKPGVKLVYKYDVPGANLTLFGLALSGDKGEGNFMPKIDVTSPKHTAFLPYELLVKGSEVHMLHGRFRIALSFPDLTMGTFTKIMSSPGDIEDLLKQLVE
ncbi:MAG: hypothetical protein ABFS32_15745 [Bacteroidota bacterium]